MRCSRTSGPRQRNCLPIPLLVARVAQKSLWSLQTLSLPREKKSDVPLFVPNCILSSLQGYKLRILVNYAYFIPLHASFFSLYSRSWRSFLLFSYLEICTESLLHTLLSQKWRGWMQYYRRGHSWNSSSLLCFCICVSY